MGSSLVENLNAAASSAQPPPAGLVHTHSFSALPVATRLRSDHLCHVTMWHSHELVSSPLLRFVHESNATPALSAGSRGSSLSLLVSISAAFSVFPHVSSARPQPPPPLRPPPPPPPLSPTRTEHLHQMRWTIG